MTAVFPLKPLHTDGGVHTSALVRSRHQYASFRHTHRYLGELNGRGDGKQRVEGGGRRERHGMHDGLGTIRELVEEDGELAHDAVRGLHQPDNALTTSKCLGTGLRNLGAGSQSLCAQTQDIDVSGLTHGEPRSERFLHSHEQRVLSGQTLRNSQSPPSAAP